MFLDKDYQQVQFSHEKNVIMSGNPVIQGITKVNKLGDINTEAVDL